MFGVGLFSVSLDVTLTARRRGRSRARRRSRCSSSPSRSTSTRPGARTATRRCRRSRCCRCWPASWPSRRAGGPARRPAGSPLVNLRALQAAEADVVLHPLGTLLVSSALVPLDITVDKVGNERSADVSRCSVSVTQGRPGQGLRRRRQLRPRPVPGPQRRPEAVPARRSSPSTPGSSSPRDGAALASFRAVRRSARYEQIVIDTPGRQATSFVAYNSTLFSHFLAGASIARSPLAQAERVLRQPFADAIAVPGDTLRRRVHPRQHRGRSRVRQPRPGPRPPRRPAHCRSQPDRRAPRSPRDGGRRMTPDAGTFPCWLRLAASTGVPCATAVVTVACPGETAAGHVSRVR